MRRSTSTIPFGYSLQGEELVEVPEELEALNVVVPMVKDKALSLREGALWLEYTTGRSLSHMGLKKIVDADGDIRLGYKPR